MTAFWRRRRASNAAAVGAVVARALGRVPRSTEVCHQTQEGSQFPFARPPRLACSSGAHAAQTGCAACRRGGVAAESPRSRWLVRVVHKLAQTLYLPDVAPRPRILRSTCKLRLTGRGAQGRQPHPRFRPPHAIAVAPRLGEGFGRGGCAGDIPVQGHGPSIGLMGGWRPWRRCPCGNQ